MSSPARDVDELGDFQTPVALASAVWDAVDLDGITHFVEPTVGLGYFIEAAPAAATTKPWFGFDINPEYIEAARSVMRARNISGTVDVKSAFDLGPDDFPGVGSGSRVMVIGNPPWVTNAHLRSAGGTNLPQKFNRFNLTGLAALTGKANFDITEAILLAVLQALRHADEVRVALLIKRSVALKVAKDVMSAAGAVSMSFSKIDAKRWFGASVEAGLLQMTWCTHAASAQSMTIFSDLSASESVTHAGIVRGQFVQSIDAYKSVDHVEATDASDAFVWRQGIKHDASRVLELHVGADGIVNGFGESVDIEPSVLSPFYKSSDLANGRPATRLFPLYQLDLRGPVPDLAARWPRLAAYLHAHREAFDARGSRIYRGKPPFMLFGVGPYTAAPFKVAVSALYKMPRFVVLAPGPQGQPPLVDDTCNLLPFQSREEAQTAADYLNSEDVVRFLSTIADLTSKRPFKVDVLRRVRRPVTASGYDDVASAACSGAVHATVRGSHSR